MHAVKALANNISEGKLALSTQCIRLWPDSQPDTGNPPRNERSAHTLRVGGYEMKNTEQMTSGEPAALLGEQL